MHVGFGNVLCANRIEAILMPLSANARRLCKIAKDEKVFHDLTAGRMTKALILMDDGKVYGCALTPRTVAQRIHNAIIEGESEDEDIEPEYEDSETH